MTQYRTLARKVSISPEKKTKQKDYLHKGQLPIIDQGQQLIGGYSDNLDLQLSCNLPVIVFGDHTRAVKYVDFPFGAGADGIKVLEPAEGIYPKFLYYATQYLVLRLEDRGYARHYQYIEKKELDIPTVPEQKSVVARIEELFSELDNGVETLRKTKQQLAVYRQAVLKKAFEGKLTSCVSMREVALKDLVYGKDGLRRGPFGSAIKKSFFVPDGFKVYEQGNAINDDPYRGRYYITQEKYEELKNFHIKPHDLLVSCSGVTLGRIVELPDDAKPGVINQALLRIRLNHEMIATRYFIEFFRSEMFQRKIFDKSQGSAMPNLVGITEFKEITLNVPHSLDDQLAIVSEIENRVSVCDNIEKTVDAALQQAEAMRQSILKKAFEGRI